MKILVTGGTGMLGRALTEYLPDAIFVSSRDADLRNINETEYLINKIAPQTVIHLAAEIGGVKANMEKNLEFFESNLLMNTNVISSSVKHGVKRFIGVLSSCAYFIPDDRPGTESDLHVGLPYFGNLGYAYSKRALDIHAQIAADKTKMPYMTVTPVTMFGPHDNFNSETGHVVAALIVKAVNAVEKNGTMSVWGSGKAIRQFVYVNDIAKILAQLIEINLTGNLIIAPDMGIEIKALAERIANAADFKGRIEFDSAKPEGVSRKVIQSKKFKEIFEDFLFTDIDKALQETVEWYRKNK